MKKLGANQAAMLHALKEHRRWYNGDSWVWDGPKSTERLLDSLVKRGLARIEEEEIPESRWRPAHKRRTYYPMPEPKPEPERPEIKECSICHAPYRGWGNNAWPVNDGRCCNDCNSTDVIPARLRAYFGSRVIEPTS